MHFLYLLGFDHHVDYYANLYTDTEHYFSRDRNMRSEYNKWGEQLLKVVKEHSALQFIWVNYLGDNLPNLPNLFSDTFDKTREFIKSNELKIKKIIFHEGNYDPNRNKINPILDWGIHPFTYVLSIFNENKIKNIKYKEIIKRNQGDQIVAKFDLILKNKLHIKIVTGNLFKKKTRTLKVILENGDVLINDFINHKIILNNIIIYKSKITPLDNLLLNFSYSINKKNNLIGLKHFDSSLESIKILERYI